MTQSWVVTGVGTISAAGDSPQSLLEALARREPLQGDGGACGPAIAIEGFEPKRYLDRKGLSNLSRTSLLACAAASRVAPALAGVRAAEVGVVLGSAWGSLKTIVDFERAAHVDGPRFVDPFLFAETVPNVPAGQVAIFFGWSACNVTVSAGSSSGTVAICTGLRLLEDGRARVVVAGGADELNPPLLRTLVAEGKVSGSGRTRPFDAAGGGPAAGEGACFLAIESREHAASRGAGPLARVLASAESTLAGGNGSGRGVAGLVRALLEKAALSPRDIDLVVTSAAGSPRIDRLEGLALLEVFGGGSGAAPMLAPKAILGETWGASGPLAVTAALECLRGGIVPAPPRGLAPVGDLVDLNLPAETTRGEVRHALVLDCAEGGQIAGLLLCREPGGQEVAS